MSYLFQYILLNLLSIMLRQLVVILICSLSTTYVYSQVDSSKLFFAKKFDSDAFVELGSRIRQVNSSAGMDIDFSVNWLVNHKYYLGAAYGQLASVAQFYSANKQSPTNLDEITQLKYQSLGLRLGYILFEEQKVISFSPELTIGWAGIKITTEENEQKINGGLISPALKGVFNVSDYFRIGVSINYNIFIFKDLDSTDDIESLYVTKFSSKGVNGVGGGIFLRIGQF